DTISTKEDVRLTKGILSLLDDYAGGDKTYKEEVIQYLKSHLRPTLKHQESSLIVLCKAWTIESKSYIEVIIRELLPVGRVTWIPDASSMKNSADPLPIILNFAETQPSAIYTAKIIMDYCVGHAIRSRNLAFLNPFFRSLYKIMHLVPQEGLQRLGRIAYIPVMNRSYIMDNHIIAHPPSWKFWKQNSTPLYKTEDPIMRLHISGKKLDPKNDSFTRPVFMASFDALWCYIAEDPPTTTAEPKEEPVIDTKREARTTWWKVLYHLIRLKCCLQIHNFVECYDFKLEFYENPAVAALVAYKWNTIGFKYWLIRFSCQFCYYSLVVITAILQVYYKEPRKLVGMSIGIIVMAAIFLWLELLQFIFSKSRYMKSGYNLLDMISFCLPMVASANQLAIIYHENYKSNTFLMSFSVLAVFLHMLFELRINRSVCKYVTIIRDAVVEIRVFFIIFAVGILAFTIASLHLLRACTYEGCEVPEPNEGLPENFFYALSVIYFFMSGRWDPVSEYFKTLINKAFASGDGGWRLVWVESRLRYIESAENLSYHIPGFRQTYGWFPKEIYFSSSLQKVQEFREKYQDTKAESNLEALEGWIRNGDKGDDYPEEKSEEDTEKDNKKNQDEEASSDDKVEELNVVNPVSDSKGGDASEEIESADKGDVTSSSAATITKFSSQIVDLKSQIGDLQRHLAAQQKQAQRQQEQMQQEQAQRQQEREQTQKQFEQAQQRQEQIQRHLAIQQEQAQRQHEEIMSLLSSLRQ
ncbi:hypothetical protein BGX27_003512, partial [Mortierella sp. AM989]